MRFLELIGHSDQIRKRTGAHLPHDLPAMNLDSDLAQACRGGDLFIYVAPYHKPHDLPLADGQSGIAFDDFGKQVLGVPAFLVTAKRGLHCVQKLLVAKWLDQEFEATALDRLDRHRDVAMPGDEDGGDGVARGEQELLEFQAADAWQANVQHQAAGSGLVPSYGE